jgi:hypothetical protein
MPLMSLLLPVFSLLRSNTWPLCRVCICEQEWVTSSQSCFPSQTALWFVIGACKLAPTLGHLYLLLCLGWDLWMNGSFMSCRLQIKLLTPFTEAL